MRFSLKIEGINVDLFQDETILLTRQVKDFSKIESVFTDYTQSFQIPATDINNKIFYNWFEESIEYANWNPNLKLTASIEIDAIPIFYGAVELLQVDYKEGLAQSYSIAFYGQVKNILTQWGEITLQELSWSEFDHTIDNATVVSSWSGGLFSGAIIWDIKDYHVGFTYSKQQITNNIYYNLGGDGIDFNDLRPSIRLKNMVNHVFTKFGYTLSGTLFSRAEFSNLYVTPMATSGPMVDYDDLQFGLFEANAVTPISIFPRSSTKSTWQHLPLGSNVVSNPSGAWSNTTFEYTIPKTGDYDFEVELNQNSGAPSQFAHYRAMINGTMVDNISGDDFFFNGYVWNIKLRKATKGQKFYLVYAVYTNVQITGTFKCSFSPYNTNPNVFMKEAMPNIKLSDFINSILQTFNAILVPKSLTEFEIHNIDDWYALGVNKDYTNYVDFTSNQHKKMDIPSVINMGHKPSEAGNSLFFKDTYSREYGSITFKPDVDFGSGELNIQSIFSIMTPSRINEVNQIGAVVSETDLDMPLVLGKDFKPIQQELILFYFQDFKNKKSWYRLGGNTLTYQPISSSYTNTPTTGASSIACTFGLESSAEGDIPTQNIYMNFWNEFISRLYSTRSRIFICQAFIPVGEWLKMALNDNIVVSGNYYKIQKIEYNILTEEAKLELISYPKVNKMTISGSTGKKPVFVDPVLNSEGKTYMNGIPFKSSIANAVYYGATGNYVADASPVDQYNYSMPMLLDSLYKAQMKSMTICKVTIWRTTAQTLTITPTNSAFAIANTGFDGDGSLFATGGNTQITINQGGQYRVRAFAVFDNSGGHNLIAEILLNGIETEGYYEFSGNHINTATTECILTINETGVIKFGTRTNDGGSHSLSIKSVNMTIEKIF